MTAKGSIESHAVRLGAAVAFLVTAAVATGQVLYVDASATGQNNGASWCNAYLDLQGAIAQAAWNRDVTEIRVAQGTYRPDQGTGFALGDREASFNLVTGVALMGGYAGCGSLDPDARDTVSYETILSGDLAGDDGPDFTNYDENSYHVVVYNDPSAAGVVLQGFTISHGMADGTGVAGETNQGSGIHIRNGSAKCITGGPTIRDCIIRDNWSAHHAAVNDHGLTTVIEGCTFLNNFSGVQGGGLLIHSGSTTVRDCSFEGNETDGEGGAVWISQDFDPACAGSTNTPKFNNCTFTRNQGARGGAIFREMADLTLEDCTFEDNGHTTLPEGSRGRGGGLYLSSGGHVSVTGCAFVRSDTGGFGAGIYATGISSLTLHDTLFDENRAYKYAALVNRLGTAVVRNCTFTNNFSSHGSAVRNYAGTLLLVDCDFLDNFGASGAGAISHTSYEIDILNCRFLRNRIVYGWGQAIVTYGGDMNIANSVFSYNNGGGSVNTGTIHVYRGNFTMVNSTLNGNYGKPALFNEANSFISNCIFWYNRINGPNVFEAQMKSVEGSLDVNHSCVEDSDGLLGGVGNTAEHPLFVSYGGADGIPGTLDDDLRLRAGSSAIDAGNNNAPGVAGLLTDLNGNDRFMNASSTADTGSGTPPIVDMGAFEAEGVGRPEESLLHNIQKNRVVSFAPEIFGNVAFRVELLDLVCGSTGKKCSRDADCLVCDGGAEAGEPCSLGSDCPTSNCVGSGESCVEQSPPVMLGWVSHPVYRPGDSPVGMFTASVQKTMPAMRRWLEPVIHVSDCEIAPVQTYVISVTGDGISFFYPLVVATTPKPQGKFWADLVGSFDGFSWSKPNFLVNVDDVVAMINYLALKPAPHITVVDLAGAAPTYTNFIVNATDLQMVLEGFGGKPWPPIAVTGLGYPADGDVTQCP